MWQTTQGLNSVHDYLRVCDAIEDLLSDYVLYNLRVNALWHHSILSDNVADNVAPEQSSAPVLLTTINQRHGHS